MATKRPNRPGRPSKPRGAGGPGRGSGSGGPPRPKSKSSKLEASRPAPPEPRKAAPKAKSAPGSASPDEGVRLQVLIARAGLGSRREAETMIRDGEVTVNGRRVTELGTKAISGRDAVKVRGRLLPMPTELVTFVHHKPMGVVTTMKDPEGRPCVGEIATRLGRGIYPVGRLDFNTSGLLLLTSDGDLAQRLAHPSYSVDKVYEVKVNARPTDRDLDRLSRGIRLEDGRTAPADLHVIKQLEKKCWLHVRIHEGRNLQIRRMFEAIGLHVDKLKRIQLGPVRLSRIPVGQTRLLRVGELDALYDLVGLRSPSRRR